MSHTFTLPISQPSVNETVAFLVSWGDSTQQTFAFDGNTWSTQDFSHYYSNDNPKTIKIYPPLGGKFGKHWNFKQANATGSAAQMRTITKWGGFEFCASGGSFKDCINLDWDTPTGTPAITWPNSLHSAFSGCTSLSPPGATGFQGWDTSAAETFYETFLGCINFNASVNGWNANNVTNTTRMFAGCDIFNQPFDWWNSPGRSTANLVTATSMFEGASSFNHPLADWDVSKLVHIGQMFKSATNFASQIFANYDSTGTVGSGAATSLEGIFLGTKFNGSNITTWDVSAISNFHGVFRNNTHFNQDIHLWDVGEGTIFESMFEGATGFNKPLNGWDTSKGTNFNSMFQGASSFNQNINTGASTTLHGSTYNPWTIGTATMDNMLHDASAFDQDLSGWNMTNVSSAINLLDGTDLSAENAAAINDSGTGWPSQSGVSAAVTNESAAAVQASGTIPYWTSYDSGGIEVISNPENTQTVVNLTATGSPTPAFSLTSWGDGSKFTLDDNGDGTATLKLTAAPDFENPTDSNGNNQYDVAVKASNSIGESSLSHLIFNVTNVADVAAPVINTLSISNATSDGFIANWDSIGAGYTYHYQVATDSGFSNIINDIDNYSGTQVVQVSLAADTTYYFRVKANGGGLGSTYEADSPSWGSASIDTAAAVMTDVTEIGTGYGHSLFRKSDGSLWGVGRNDFGQLGDGTTTHRNSPVQISSSSSAQFAGGLFTVFVKPDGSLWGTGDQFASLTPVEIVPSGVINVAAGHYHIVFVKSDGSLWAMGVNGKGQLGDGTTTGRASPVQILPSGVTQVFAGSQTTHFLKSDGSLWGMGSNFNGQLGDGTVTQRNSPVQILASGVVAVTKYGGSQHTLFLKSDGSLWGTGQNFYGQLGVAPYDNRNGSIREIVPSGVISMAAGYAHSLFLKSDGSLWAMGRNDRGQLGDGTITQRNSPVQILASGVTKVTAGYQHSFFQKSDDSIWGMGLNAYGVLGSDAPDDSPGDATGPYAFSPIRL